MLDRENAYDDDLPLTRLRLARRSTEILAVKLGAGHRSDTTELAG